MTPYMDPKRIIQIYFYLTFTIQRSLFFLKLSLLPYFINKVFKHLKQKSFSVQ